MSIQANRIDKPILNWTRIVRCERYLAFNPGDTRMADDRRAHPVPDRHGVEPVHHATPSCAPCSRCTCRPTLPRTCSRISSSWARWPAACSTTLAQHRRPPSADARAPHPQRHRRCSASSSTRPMSSSSGSRSAEFGLAAMSHRGGVLGWDAADAAGGQVRADLPVRAGRVRPVLPAVDDRFADAHAAQVRRPGAGRALPAAADHAGLRRRSARARCS